MENFEIFFGGSLGQNVIYLYISISISVLFSVVVEGWGGANMATMWYWLKQRKLVYTLQVTMFICSLF